MLRKLSRHTSALVLLSLVPLAAVRPAAASAQKLIPTEEVKITLAGDSIVNRRLSVFNDPASTGLFDFIRQSDVGFTNFETLITNYAYPGASGCGVVDGATGKN
jgi:hypothetical protein